MTEHYYADYPKKAIGKGNPYYRCAFCGVSDPEINGQIENHRPWCEYRILKSLKEKQYDLCSTKKHRPKQPY